jgi:AcrR family transcriptional regulator
MTRAYVKRARAEAAATTQRRIIEAARAVLVDGEVPSLELAQVAEQAGVARSTIYLSFGTRSAFLAKVLDDSLNRAGFGRVREYLILPDAVEAMEKTLAQATIMYSAEHTVLQRMLLLAKFDPDVSRDYQERQQRRAAAMRDLAKRLAQQRRLRAGVSVETAASVLWALTSFETFDQLYSGWDLSAKTSASRIVMIARASLL